MDQMDWTRKLDRLKQGELRLEEPGDSGMTAYANTSLYELREYVKALEQGYRRRGSTISSYRHMEKARELARMKGRSLRELMDEAWSERACLGYAVLGLRQAGLRDGEIERVIEAMRENLQAAGLEDAEGAFQTWADRRKPEWIRPSAEMKPTAT